MTSLRRQWLFGFLLLIAGLDGLELFSQGGLTIGGYQQISETRITRTVSEYVYRASLVNNGSPIGGATATATSVSPYTTIVDGNVTFGAVGSNSSVVSSDTFSFRHDRTVPFDWANIQWTIAGQGGNRPPVAHAGPDQTVAAGSPVTLNGSGSSDADGNPLTFAWTLTTRPAGSVATLANPTSVSPTFVADLPGSYVATLVVNDGLTNSTPDTVSISTTNSPPVANAGPDQTVALGGTATLNGSASSDADGNPLTFSWSFTSRPAGSTAVLLNPTGIAPNFVADRPGTYIVRLIVNDGFANSAPDTVSISTTNSSPVANAGPDQTVATGSTVTLNGGGSTDADGNSLTFSWSFVSRPAGSTAVLSNPSAIMPTFVADRAGSFVVQLIVNDGTAASAPDTVTINTSNSPPIANAGPDQSLAVGSVVFLDGSGSSDADGNALTFSWSFTSRPAGSTATLSGATTPGPSFVIDRSGSYVIQLVVNDGLVNGAPDTVTITTTNSTPVANAGPDQIGVSVSNLVTLFGGLSSDPDGHPLTFGWSFTSRPAGSTAALTGATSASPTFTPDLAGDYLVQLVVNDGFVNSPPDTVLIRAVSVVHEVNVMAADAFASEAGPDPGAFTFTRSGNASTPLQVFYTVGGTAASVLDYGALSGVVTIPAGQVAATVNVVPVDDATFEGDETVVVSISSSAAYIIGAGNTASVTIADNDVPTVTVVATDSAAGEAGPNPGTFTFTRTGLTTNPLTVSYGANGTATGGGDYTPALSGTVTILAGQSSASATITPVDDNLFEGDETVVVALAPSAAYSIGAPGSASITIADNDVPTVTVTATDASAAEAGANAGTFTFTRTGATASALTVSFGVGGTATNGTDYAPTLGGSVTIASGQTSASLTITPSDDADFEGDETVVVTLAANAGYTISGPGTATVTIADNDVPTVTVTATDASAAEAGANAGTFTVTRTGPTTSALTVAYAVAGTATNGTDFTPTLSGTATIASGQSATTLTMTPVDDNLFEGDETVVVTLSTNAAYSIGAAGTATVTIADNDVPTVTVTATDALAAEAGANPGTFTFTRTGPTTPPLDVLFTVGGSATNGTDYAPTLGTTVTIAAGQASATLTITPGDDAAFEGDETVAVTLATNAAYSIGAPGSATITITDNDVPTVTLAATDANASEAGSDPGAFTFTRTGPTTSALLVRYSVGGNIGGDDFTPSLTGTITIPAGQSSVVLTITPVDDSTFESTESIILALVADPAYTIGSPATGTVTIGDNDEGVVTIAVTDNAAAELGPNLATFVVSRTGPTTSARVVTVFPTGTADLNGDYTLTSPAITGGGANSVIVTIPAGQASVTLTVTPIFDPVVEPTETVILTVDGSSAQATVADEPAATIAVVDASAAEAGADVATFVVTRGGPSTYPRTVAVFPTGSADLNGDYTLTSPTLAPGGGNSVTVTIPVGQTSVTLTVTPIGDGIVEGNETVILSAEGSSGTATIVDEVATVAVSATDATASEAGLNPGTFTLTRTGSTASALNVSFGVGGTASNGVDFTPSLSGSVTIPVGQSSATLTITPVDDATFEGDETVVVTLAANAAYSIAGGGTATVTIADNDVPTVTVQATDAAAAEAGANAGTFTFTRTGSTAALLNVSFTVGGTATNGSDYTPSLTGTVTIPAGQASTALTITPTDDALLEGDETAIVTLSANAAYTIGASSAATVTIADDEVAPVVTVAATVPAAAEQGSAGPTNGVFQFSRTGATTSALTVQYVVGGTATSAVDYAAIPTDITFAAGQATVSRTIAPIFDGVAGGEGDEAVVVTLTDGASYDVGTPSSATVTIADALTPVVTVAALDANASENADSGTFRFTRTVNTFGTLSVTYSVTGTATNGTDYTLLSGTVTFPNNQAVVDVQVTPILDGLAEAGETAILTLVDGADYNLGTGTSATVTIADFTPPVITVLAAQEMAEAGASENFQLRRTGGVTETLTVQFTLGGTATNGVDYATVSGQATFPVGSSTVNVTIDPVVDTLVEGLETVILTLTDGSAYDLGAASTATTRIADALVSISVTDATASEDGPDPGAFTISRTGDTTGPLTVDFTVAGSAARTIDYVDFGTSVTIPAGQASAVLTVTPILDALTEGVETVIVSLLNGQHILAGGSVILNIADSNAPTITVAATDGSASEAGANPGTFTFTRTGNVSAVLSGVTYVRTGTATAGTDFTPNVGTPSTITFAPGSATATLTFTPVNDPLVEGDETVIVTLTDGAAYNLGAAGTETATITIADQPIPVITVAATDAAASEAGPDPGTFTFTRVGDTSLGLSGVTYTRTGTATPGTDFSPNIGSPSTINFPAGAATVTLTFTPVNDPLVEGDETIVVTVTDGAQYNLGAAGTETATVTIADDTIPVITVAATDASASEVGPDAATFTFTRTGDTSLALIGVTYTRTGTATPGSDFTPNIGSPSTINFAAGSATATVMFTPVDDALVEGDETIIVTVTDGANYNLGTPASETATVTITDNVVPLITVEATDASASEANADPGTFTFTRTGNVSLPLNGVTYTRTGTATPGSDFTPNIGSPSTINFAADSATATVTFTPVNDALVEGDETIIVTVTDGANYNPGTAGSETATVTIADNAVPVVTVAATDPGASEANGDPGTFTFARTGNVSLPLNGVTYTRTGTATPGSDFTPNIGSPSTINFAAGSATATVTFTPVDDVLVEGDEAIIVTVTDGANYNLGAAGTETATITIADNAVPVVTVSATDATASEAGPDAATFTFTRTGNTSLALTNVTYTRTGTATPGTDFTPNISNTSTISFTAGSATATLTLTPVNDALAEGAETIVLTLTDGAQYDLGAPGTEMATATIADQSTPLITIAATDNSASEVGSDTATFTFTRTGDTTLALNGVAYNRTGTATPATDFTPNIGASATINFAAGSATATLTITPVLDALVEGSETVILTLVDGAAYDLGASQSATAAISDNSGDGGPLVNSVLHTGEIATAGEVDSWTFTANVGDRIAVFIGEIVDNNDFRPFIRLNAPNGTLLAQSFNLEAAQLDDVIATATGTYTVLVSSADTGSDGTGTYRLTMTHTPGPITVSPGDEGGLLTNGGIHTGTILQGDLDVWTFTANAGDRIAVNIGEIADTDDFRPWIRLWAPNSASLGDTWNLAAAEIDDAVAPVTGTYLVLVASADAGVDGTGTYRLTMAHTPGPITVSSGDQGGPLTNGGVQTGEILRGDLDVWTFTANAGERIGIHIGELTDANDFRPWIRLWGPAGTSNGDTWNVAAAAIDDVVAPATGTYLVLVASADAGLEASGTYQLSMTHTPGPITVPAGDEGGPLTNGAMHTGTISLGELDVWTFTANAGDRIAVNIGEIVDNNDFRPWIRLWAPNNASIGDTWNVAAAQLDDVVAPVTGTYLLLVASADAGLDGSGTYRLTMTHTPGPISVSAGDDGGPLTNGGIHTGAIVRGDLDVWTFTANAGERIAVNIGELTDPLDFRPWIRLWAPNGASVGDTWNVAAAELDDVVAPVTGTYLVLVASADAGVEASGTYQLTMTHTPGPITVSAGDDGGPLTNGGMHTGTITRGDLDIWTFTATAGDRIAVNIGEIVDNDDFRPWIRLWTPNGGSSGDTWNVAAAQIDDAVAPVTGTYLVLVASADAGVDGAGTYRLSMTHTPGPITVSSGDEGGALTNGATHTGAIASGDLDVWTFNANAGERIAIHIGETSDPLDFRPWIRLWAPNGGSVGDTWNVVAAQIDDAVAPVTGTYLVLVASADAGVEGSGTYQLTMTHTPGPVAITPGDEGGPIGSGSPQSGAIGRGDLDVWTFTATAGTPLTVQIAQTGETDDFRPWIRLWSPAGGSLGDVAGVDTTQIGPVNAPVTGTYLVLVASADSGVDGIGTYSLVVTGATGGASLQSLQLNASPSDADAGTSTESPAAESTDAASRRRSRRR